MGLGQGSVVLGRRLSLLFISWTVCLHLSANVAEAQQPELCSLPKAIGPCKAAFRRFYYNSATQRCDRFIFGGCRANANNFKTLAQCQSACTCSLPMNMGYWRQNGRYCTWAKARYYDSITGSCRPFLYWGCGGNGNRFRSNQECSSTCAASPCYAPTQRRRCSSGRRSRQSQRYFYNAARNQCQTFIYNGCSDKNENSFTSKQACSRRCIQRNA